MAGVYEDGHFSVMTTAPNRWMREIHPRMPVVLRPGELDVWLRGDYPALADRQQVRLETIKVA
jgi:putative SOS response-associated peptidase YedK